MSVKNYVASRHCHKKDFIKIRFLDRVLVLHFVYLGGAFSA